MTWQTGTGRNNAAHDLDAACSVCRLPRRSKGKRGRSRVLWLLTSALCLLSSIPLATEHLYIPPQWSRYVVFYHSFENGSDKPEINEINATVQAERATATNGFVGKGYTAANEYDKKKALKILSPALSAHRPITVMHWFRLDAPMKPETCFSLLWLSGPKGYVSSFVRGKGEWCALKEPTCISQVQGFPGIPNLNNPWGGKVSFGKGEWHHVAITIANASKICVYWDGVLKETITVKGREFKDGEMNSATLDSNPFFFPMTIDEVLVLNLSLSAKQIADYYKSASAMKAIGFRFEASDRQAAETSNIQH